MAHSYPKNASRRGSRQSKGDISTSNSPLNQVAPSLSTPTSTSAILLLLQYAEVLGSSTTKKTLSFWQNFINDFYSDEGIMRFSLWNHSTNDSRSFELNTILLPRFYHVMYSSGVTEITLSLEGLKEMTGPSTYIESPKATMIYHLEGGSQVVAVGHLRVIFNSALKIEYWDFVTKQHTEYHSRNSLLFPTSPPKSKGRRGSLKLPESKVNDFGVTIPTMRCLEIGEVVYHMRDLIGFSYHQSVGPSTALRQVATMLMTEAAAQPPGATLGMTSNGTGAPNSTFSMHHPNPNMPLVQNK